MHLQPNANSDWTTTLLPFLEKCAVFATEFDLADADPTLLAQYSRLPDRQQLSDFIALKKLVKLEGILFKSTGLRLTHFSTLKPLFITNLLTEKILADDHSIAMDRILYQMAMDLNKDCTGIETFAEQLAILNKIPLEDQVKSLLKIGKNIGRFRKNLQKMLAVYQRGDVQAIHRMARKGTGKLRKLMLYQRNELMSNRIFKKIEEKAIFCAIGAGHLGGKRGVLRLLKHKGLIVQPVPFQLS